MKVDIIKLFNRGGNFFTRIRKRAKINEGKFNVHNLKRDKRALVKSLRNAKDSLSKAYPQIGEDKKEWKNRIILGGVQM